MLLPAVVVLISFSFSKGATSFDACHLSCQATNDFDNQDTCQKGCELASARRGSIKTSDCATLCSNNVNCIQGCRYEVEGHTGVEDLESKENKQSTNLNDILQHIMEPKKMFIRFKWLIFRNPDNTLETTREEPAYRAYYSSQDDIPDNWSRAWTERLACIRRHRFAFPFLVSLCFLLLFSLILLTISVMYRLKEARRRRFMLHTINFDSLPSYKEVSQTKMPLIVDTEAGPLPEKKPIEA